MATKEQSHGYQLFMLSLCLYALLALAAEVVLPLSASTREILEIADYGVCLVFLIDFVIALCTAENRLRYFFTWGWIDLASSIPSIGFFRLGRAARIMRVFRVLRGVRATRIVTGFVLDRRANSTFLAAALVSILLLVFCSVAILKLEIDPASNIKTPADAMWWSAVTITTVGYGDKFPVTSEGRVLAVCLMTAGVGLFGTFSGFVASWFLAPVNRQQDNEMEALRKELKEIKELLKTEQRAVLSTRE